MTRGRHNPIPRKPDGKFDKDSRCFIATAAYGRSDAPSVLILRAWRDRSLSKTRVGRALILAYYRVSPPIAAFLKRNRWAAGITRRALDVVVRTVKGSDG